MSRIYSAVSLQITLTLTWEVLSVLEKTLSFSSNVFVL